MLLSYVALAPRPRAVSRLRVKHILEDALALGNAVRRMGDRRSLLLAAVVQAIACVPLVLVVTRYRFGVKPLLAQILTKISGVGFDDGARDAVVATVDGRLVSVIGRAALLQNKRAAGRHKDLDDVEWLVRRDG